MTYDDVLKAHVPGEIFDATYTASNGMNIKGPFKIIDGELVGATQPEVVKTSTVDFGDRAVIKNFGTDDEKQNNAYLRKQGYLTYTDPKGDTYYSKDGTTFGVLDPALSDLPSSAEKAKEIVKDITDVGGDTAVGVVGGAGAALGGGTLLSIPLGGTAAVGAETIREGIGKKLGLNDNIDQDKILTTGVVNSIPFEKLLLNAGRVTSRFIAPEAPRNVASYGADIGMPEMGGGPAGVYETINDAYKNYTKKELLDGARATTNDIHILKSTLENKETPLSEVEKSAYETMLRFAEGKLKVLNNYLEPLQGPQKSQSWRSVTDKTKKYVSDILNPDTKPEVANVLGTALRSTGADYAKPYRFMQGEKPGGVYGPSLDLYTPNK